MKMRKKNKGAVFLIVVFAIALFTTITVGILVMTTEEVELMQNQLYAANALCTAGSLMAGQYAVTSVSPALVAVIVIHVSPS